MNIFATIIAVETFTFKEVKYYSVQFNDKEVNEFFDFLNRMEDIPEIEEDLGILFDWLELIGEEFSALSTYFRHEKVADALPPPKRQMKLVELELESDLRLYCLRANEHVVFLFNGGIKTTDKAQDCPNVSSYFRQANKLADEINKKFMSGEISWNSNHTDIDIEPNLEIEL